MLKELGSTLPQDVLDYLSDSGQEDKFKDVILFSTIDEDGWPHHGWLRHHEVAAKDSRRLLILLYSDSTVLEMSSERGNSPWSS